jgi:Fibronectin type III domain
MPVKRASRPRTFTVTASNAHGSSVKSLPSNPVTASTAPISRPGVPQTVKAYVEGSRASIHFGDPKDNAEGITAYAVTVRPGGRRQVFTGRRTLTLEGRHVTFVTMDGLTPGTKYTFGVSAVNPLGEGEPAWSNDSADTSQP